jgi:flagellar hook-associated protein FlgK
LVKARNELDALAIGFMNAVNKVQVSGLDGAGQEGREMFGLAGEMSRAAADLQMVIKSGDEIATGALLMVD